MFYRLKMIWMLVVRYMINAMQIVERITLAQRLTDSLVLMGVTEALQIAL